MLGIWHHNLLLTFSPGQFHSFKDFTTKLDMVEAMFPFPDGEERFVLRTPTNDISLAFSLNEWEDFQTAMEEAEYMMGIYDIFKN